MAGMQAQHTEIEAKPSAAGPALGLGKLLCERSSPEGPWIWGVLLLALALSATVGLVTALTLPEPHLLSVWIAAGIAAPALTGGLVCLRPRGGDVAFYEEGASWQAFGRTKTVRYTEADRIRYDVVRERDKRGELPPVLEMLIRTSRGTIRYRGEYLTRIRSTGFMGPKVALSIDELDDVRERVASVIADRLQEALGQGKAINWCGEAELTTGGLVLMRGARQGDVIRYRSIERIGEKDGLLSLLRDGQSRAILTMPTGGMNFWPCLVLLERLVIEQRRAAEAAEASSQSGATVAETVL
jgi:hypothetical protein